MAGAATATRDAGHKTRGGSALSLALSKASPPLVQSSPVDTVSSGLSKEAAAWLSTSAASTLTASPAGGSDSLATAASAQQQPGHPPLLPLPVAQLPLAPAPAQPHPRRLFPFLSCFGGAAFLHAEDASVRPVAAVSASEVGIRPCFYWLEAPAMSQEERMFAEANARWLKSDCQVRFGGLFCVCFCFCLQRPTHSGSSRDCQLRFLQWLAGAGAAAIRWRRRVDAAAALKGCLCNACDTKLALAQSHWLRCTPCPPCITPRGLLQDDAVVIEHFGGLPHQTFAGVFDGHGPYGRAAAKLASTRLPQLLAAKSGGSGASCSERKRLRAMREAFLDVNAAMQDMGQAGFDASLSGTTACCVLVVGRKVIVASTGDSRCVVARRRAGAEAGIEVVPLTWDAKPSLPEEQRRIAMSGAQVALRLGECCCH